MTQQGFIQIIVNPVSGGSSGRHLLAAIGCRLTAAGYAVETFVTSGRGDAARFAADLPIRPDQRVVVIGGDGTVREVATSLRGPEIPIVVFPMGTENLVAKYFRMQKDLDVLLERLNRGKPVRVDVGQVRLSSKRVEKFLLVAGIGFDAEVVRRLTASRRGHICHQDYFWPIWRTFWGYHHPTLRVETDEGLSFEGRGMVFIGNIPRYAVGLRILPRANPQDGKLDVCVLACTHRSTLLRHAFNVLRRHHPDSSGVIYRQVKTVRVSAGSPVSVELDGDLADPLDSNNQAMNAEFTLTDQQVSFLASPSWQA